MEPCYAAKAFARACRELGLRHVRTKPYTPRTNGGRALIQSVEAVFMVRIRSEALKRPSLQCAFSFVGGFDEGT
jgi:hypothetical protein